MKFISNHLFKILSFIAISASIYEAWMKRWVCDDAFISYIYARNLREGLGLIFQVGEYVEGYTNFLWTILLSLSLFVLDSPIVFSQVFGILFFLFLLIFFFGEERNLRPYTVLPIFVVHLASFYHGILFATSGLETMMFTFFLSVGLVQWNKKYRIAGIWLLFAAITRPEGALFLFGFLVWFLFSLYKGSKTNSLLENTAQNKWEPKYLIPNLIFIFIIGLAFLIFIGFRYSYYGDFLPNTFYAKAGRTTYVSQGFFYLLYWFRAYPFYIPIFVTSIILILKPIFLKRLIFDSIHYICILGYIFYVIIVGGDFMAMRFWLPIIPFLSWIFYLSFSSKLDELQIESNIKNTWNRIFKKNTFYIQFLFLSSLAIYINPIRSVPNVTELWHGIGEERMFYENSLSLGSGYDGEAFRDFRVAFYGAQAHFIYFMRPAYALEAETGLTDYLLARENRKLDRGRVGHENFASLEMLKVREIDFLLANKFPHLNLPSITYQFRNFNWQIYVLKYNPKKFQSLCTREKWDCSLLYKEVEKRKLDINKNHGFYND